jgi:hypothetical protein
MSRHGCGETTPDVRERRLDWIYPSSPSRRRPLQLTQFSTTKNVENAGVRNAIAELLADAIWADLTEEIEKLRSIPVGEETVAVANDANRGKVGPVSVSFPTLDRRKPATRSVLERLTHRRLLAGKLADGRAVP